VRLRLRRRVAPFDARARCSGVVHVGCAARRFRSVVARRAAACAVDTALLVSLQGARLARFSALSRGARRARRVCGGSRGGGEMRRVGCAAARRAGWRRAKRRKEGCSEVDSRARCRRLFRLFAGARAVCRCVLSAGRVPRAKRRGRGAGTSALSLSEKAPAERLARTPRRRQCCARRTSDGEVRAARCTARAEHARGCAAGEVQQWV